MKTAPHIDRTLTLVVVASLAAGCYLVLQPFMTAFVWAAILCATTWPMFEWAQGRLRGHKSLAALAMVLMFMLLLLAPLIVVGMTIAENADRVARFVQALVADGVPPVPDWVARIPLVGESIAAYWSGFSFDTAEVMKTLGTYVEPARKLVVAGGAAIVSGVLQLLLSILIAFFFYRDGDAVFARVGAAIDRLGGERGRRLANVAVITVRGAVLGILGTALVQGVLVAVALAVSGIRSAPLLGFVAFLLSPVPGGPAIVWLPAGLWLMHEGQSGWGIFVLLWGALFVSTIDNFIRPIIIGRGSDLPFVLILLGVLGGAVAFGFIGLFLGPVLIAVGYGLVQEWAATPPPAATGAPAAADPESAQADRES